ncbi:Lysine-specific demethylase 5A [Homalodisca vitripennis]|nr:Lysine-specific demethylase 5A [Homalodisca vitripennis]
MCGTRRLHALRMERVIPSWPQPLEESNLVSLIFTNSVPAYIGRGLRVSKIRVKKHLRKSPLVPRMMEEPPLALSQEGLLKLQELMTEGDLMEVSLEETNVIWRILQATKPQNLRSKCHDDEDESETDSETIKSLKERVARSKRIFEDIDISSGNYPSTSSGATSNTKKLKVRNPRDTSKDKKFIHEGANRERKKRTVRETGPSGKKSGKSKRSRQDDDEESSDEEEDELCAAPVCRRPTGRIKRPVGSFKSMDSSV